MRSFWKNPHFNAKVCSQLHATAYLGRKRTLVLRHRRLIIDSSMATRFFAVPNGRGRIKLGIHPEMVGHRLGEFVRTRRRVQHYRKKRQKALEKRRKEEAKKSGPKAVDLARINAMRQKRKSRK